MMVVAKIKSFFQTALNFALIGAFFKKTVFHPQAVTDYPTTFGDAFATIFIHLVLFAGAGALIGTVPKIKNKLKGKLSIIVPVLVGTAPIIFIILNAIIMSIMKWQNATIAAPSIVFSIFCGWFALYIIGGPSSGYTGFSPA